jgi:hypothetical protein
MKNKYREAAANLSNYGYSQEGGYGLTPGLDVPQLSIGGTRAAAPVRNPASNSINPDIQRNTAGCSTLRITISNVITGTGSDEADNTIALFGGDAFTNASRGYNAVIPDASKLTTALAVSGGKNVITFKYVSATDPGANYSTYTVTLGTAGEYPFVLSSFTGDRGATVKGLQMNISDASETTQLSAPMQTFFLNEFGKSSSNDLSTPPDLYQQADNGIWLPHEFPISGRHGFMLDVLDVTGFSVDLYLFVK